MNEAIWFVNIQKCISGGFMQVEILKRVKLFNVWSSLTLSSTKVEILKRVKPLIFPFASASTKVEILKRVKPSAGIARM